jgi:integrase
MMAVQLHAVATAKTASGQAGRPSQALTLEQAAALLEAAEDSRLHAYIVLCLLTGVRSEEARALTWDHVDLDARTISVWRSVRAHGDTKTNRSRRTLRIPQIAVEALQGQLRRQAEERSRAGELWQEHGLVFTTTVGSPYESHNLRRDFHKGTAAAGLGARWVPKELRTSFVSMMSYQGVPVEEIARLAGHASSRTTEVVYRRELRPVITTGAEIMDQIFQPKHRRVASAEVASALPQSCSPGPLLADPGLRAKSQSSDGRCLSEAARGRATMTVPACARAAESRRDLIRLATVVTISTTPMTVRDRGVLISGTR